MSCLSATAFVASRFWSVSFTRRPSLSSQRAPWIIWRRAATSISLPVRAKIEAQNYKGALAELRDLADDTQNADIYNLLGFTLRKTGDYATSLSYYTKALDLQPDHKAAREYLGELYVETGNMDKAKEQLATLTKLCPAGCEEREDLEKAIASK